MRQSSLQQVLHHRESQRNQYALVERAVALGWPAERVRVIDADLGQSGQDSQRRGFQELVAEVSLGRVGVILAYVRQSVSAQQCRLVCPPRSGSGAWHLNRRLGWRLRPAELQ